MKVETWLFSGGVLFFAPIGFVYGFVTQWQEPVGTVAIFVTSGLALLIGIYLFVVSRRIDDRPEDSPSAEISEGAGELGDFAPFSYWPMPLALGGALCFAGLAIGWWLFFIGVGVSMISLVGWVYEFYRGEHAH